MGWLGSLSLRATELVGLILLARESEQKKYYIYNNKFLVHSKLILQ
jgi:hypothetical protein